MLCSGMSREMVSYNEASNMCFITTKFTDVLVKRSYGELSFAFLAYNSDSSNSGVLSWFWSAQKMDWPRTSIFRPGTMDVHGRKAPEVVGAWDSGIQIPHVSMRSARILMQYIDF